MFRCEACGALFEVPKMIPESRGEFWGIPCHEDVAYSPCCEDDFVEGKLYYAAGKTFYYDEDENKNFHIADFDGEYFAEDEDALYDEILSEEQYKWYKKYPGYDIDIVIEVYEEEV